MADAAILILTPISTARWHSSSTRQRSYIKKAEKCFGKKSKEEPCHSEFVCSDLEHTVAQVNYSKGAKVQTCLGMTQVKHKQPATSPRWQEKSTHRSGWQRHSYSRVDSPRQEGGCKKQNKDTNNLAVENRAISACLACSNAACKITRAPGESREETKKYGKQLLSFFRLCSGFT